MSEPHSRARAVLVTGAARGLARGIAADLARDHRVAFTYRPGGTGPEATVERARRNGGEARPIAADHAQEGATAAAVRAAEAALGGVDALVHAVGPMIVARFERATYHDYRAMLDANLSSAVEAAQAVLPGMRARRFGRLVFFGMNGSSDTRPARGLSFYAAAKAGVVAFARTLALEEARHGVTVNAIEIGDIRDKDASRAAARGVAAKNPTGAAGSWEDVARAVRFLIADEAGFINGAVLAVNGGLTGAHE